VGKKVGEKWYTPKKLLSYVVSAAEDAAK